MKTTINKILLTATVLIFAIEGVWFQVIGRKYSILLFSFLLAFLIVMMLCDNQFEFHRISNVFDVREVSLIIAMSMYHIARYNNYLDRKDLSGHIIWITAPIILYVFGKYFILYENENIYLSAKLIILPFALGLMVNNIVNIISAYIYGFEGYDGRDWYSIMPQVVQRVTFYHFYPLIVMSLFIWAIYTIKKSTVLSFIIILTGLFSAGWFFLVAKSRTSFFVMALAILLNFLMIGLERILDEGIYKYKNKAFIFFGGILLALFFVIVIYTNNIFGIKDAYLNSTFCRDAPILENPRIFMVKDALSKLGEYPFGNNHTEVYKGYMTTHVSWIEIAYCAGIIPFTAIIIWLLLTFKDIVSLMLSKKVSLEYKMFIISTFFAVFLYSCTESLADRFAWYAVMLFAGMIRGSVLNVRDA